MPPNKTELAKQLIVGSPSEWIKPFDINKYVGNPPLIEKLWEERQLALTENFDLKNQLRVAESTNHSIELENQRLRSEIDNAKYKSIITLVLSGLATILTGLGINLVTADLEAKQSLFWTGIVLIVMGSVVEGLAIVQNMKRDK